MLERFDQRIINVIAQIKCSRWLLKSMKECVRSKWDQRLISKLIDGYESVFQVFISVLLKASGCAPAPFQKTAARLKEKSGLH